MLSTVVPRGEGACGFIGLMADITDLKRNQERMLAHQKLESLGVLAQGVAHDVNNLLGTILSEADLALSELPEDSPVQGSLERIKSVAIRDSEIVTLLGAYAGSGKDAPVEPLNLSVLVADTVRLLRNSLSRKAVIQTKLDPGLPVIWANSTQVRQIVMNLAINASEALGDRAGSITFTTTRAGAGRRGIRKRRVRPAGSCGLRLRHERGSAGQSLRPVLLHKVHWEGLGTGRGAGYRPVVRRNPRCPQRFGPGLDVRISLPCAQPEGRSTARALVQAV